MEPDCACERCQADRWRGDQSRRPAATTPTIETRSETVRATCPSCGAYAEWAVTIPPAPDTMAGVAGELADDWAQRHVCR